MGIMEKFWLKKKITEMTREEWEAICDGCGVCCLEKLEDEDTGEIFYTNVTCSHLDNNSCQCLIYADRYDKAPECFDLTPENIHEVPWLPDTCAYRLINEGQPLFWWHYLISGSRDSVHSAGISIRSRSLKSLNDFLNKS